MKLVSLYAVVAALAALALGACGEDEPVQETAPAVTDATDTAETSETERGDGAESEEGTASPAGDRAQITIALESIFTGGDPDQACSELVTERYLRRSYGDAAGCYAAQKDERPAKSVAIREIVMNGSLAQAQARPRGGLYDGQLLRAELVLDGGSWRLDSLRSNVPVGP